MSPGQLSCQQQNAPDFSRLSCPHWLVLARRLVWYLRSSGIRVTTREAWRFVGRHAPAACNVGKSLVRPRTYVEALGLQPGEWIEVKSENEILGTLDAAGKCRGLAFLPEMRAYCGRQFYVYKRLELIFLEESRQIRRMKNTVLLKGVFCDGVGGIGCDRSCHFYWREAWLRRAAVSGSTVLRGEAEGI